MGEYPTLDAFSTAPVSNLGWKFSSDDYGRMTVKFHDTKAALGAVRFRAFDDKRTILLKYRAIFMLAGNRGVVTSNEVQYPVFAPEKTTDVQYLKAVMISLPASDRDEFSLSYSGVISYYRQPVQTPVGPVADGEWLGRTGTGPEQAWLSIINLTISRRSSASDILPPFTPSAAPATPASSPPQE